MTNLVLSQSVQQERMNSTRGERAARLCQVCGDSARVHVLVGYESGKPKLNDYCIACAKETAHERDARPVASRERIRFGSVLVLLGASLAVIGAWGALFGVSGSEGFGWYQRLGVIIGALVAICGGLLRIELVALAGAIVAGLSAGIDFVATEHSQSGAWLSYGLACLGLAFMLAGLVGSRRVFRSARDGGDSCNR